MINIWDIDLCLYIQPACNFKSRTSQSKTIGYLRKRNDSNISGYRDNRSGWIITIVYIAITWLGWGWVDMNHNLWERPSVEWGKRWFYRMTTYIKGGVTSDGVDQWKPMLRITHTTNLDRLFNPIQWYILHISSFNQANLKYSSNWVSNNNYRARIYFFFGQIGPVYKGSKIGIYRITYCFDNITITQNIWLCFNV